MMNELREQAEGLEQKLKLTIKVDFKRKRRRHKISPNETTNQSNTICTGASAKYLGLPSEQKLIGGGVSASRIVICSL